MTYRAVGFSYGEHGLRVNYVVHTEDEEDEEGGGASGGVYFSRVEEVQQWVDGLFVPFPSAAEDALADDAEMKDAQELARHNDMSDGGDREVDDATDGVNDNADSRRATADDSEEDDGNESMPDVEREEEDIEDLFGIKLADYEYDDDDVDDDDHHHHDDPDPGVAGSSAKGRGWRSIRIKLDVLHAMMRIKKSLRKKHGVCDHFISKATLEPCVDPFCTGRLRDVFFLANEDDIVNLKKLLECRLQCPTFDVLRDT